MPGTKSQPSVPDRVKPRDRQGKISVILPNYNDGKVIGRAVAAMLGQSRLPSEIIIIDDGSTDDSVAVIEKLCRENNCIRLIKSNVNEGVVRAQNRGLERAQGEYFYLAAADDVLLPGFFEKMAALLDRYPEAGLGVCDTKLRFADGKEPVDLHLSLRQTPGFLAPADFLEQHRRNPTHILTISAIYRRAFACEVMPLDSELKWHADYFMNYVLALRHGICYQPEALSLRIEGKPSYSSGKQSWSRQAKVLSRFLDLLSADRFRDVAQAFRLAAVIPDTQLRTAVLVLGRSEYRWYSSRGLAKRLAWGAVLHLLSPLVPFSLRRLYFRLFHARRNGLVARGPNLL